MATIRMKVSGLALDKTTKSPFVLLRDEDERFALPIYIGLMEANAIAMELEKMKFPRPMTHDLLASVIRHMGGSLVRMVVTELRENTYFAKLFVRLSDDTVVEVDARPSDSIALALRMEAPIEVQEQVLLEARADSQAKEEQEREKWKEFLENLSEEDFGKYRM